MDVPILDLFEQCGRLLQGSFREDADFTHAYRTFLRLCLKIYRRGWGVGITQSSNCVFTTEEESGQEHKIPVRKYEIEIFLYDNPRCIPPQAFVAKMRALALIASPTERPIENKVDGPRPVAYGQRPRRHTFS